MAREDLRTYIEKDDNNKLTVTQYRAEGVDVDQDEDVYLYKDKGANHFDALDIDFEIYKNSASLDGSIGGMGFANTVASTVMWADTDISVSIQETTAGNCRIYLYRGYYTASDYYEASDNTPYYCTLLRAAGNDITTVDIYSDSARTNLLDTLSVAGYGTTKWRYVYGFVSRNTGSGGVDFDGYVQNLDLKGPIAHILSLSDSIAIGDSLVKAIGLVRTDNVAIVDAISKAVGLIKSDNISVTDSISKAVGLVKAETIGITDSISKAISLVKADSIAITDSISFIHKAFRLIKTFIGRNLSDPTTHRDLSDDNDEWRKLQ